MATDPVTTTVTELPESRVRVEAEVPAAEVEKRVARAARARPRPARARLPLRQGPAAGRDQARRARGGPRRGRARVDRRLVLGRDRRRRGGARSASPTSTSSDLPGRGQPLNSRSRSACARRRARRLQGLEVGRAARPTPATTRSPRRSTACASTPPSSRPSTAPPSAGDFMVMDSPGRRRRRRRSPAARDATRWSSSAPAGWCPASRSNSRAPGPAMTAPSSSPSPRTTRAKELAGWRPEFAVTVKKVKAKDLPGSTTTWPPRPGSTRSTSCARTSAGRIAEAKTPQMDAQTREAALDATVGRRDDRGARRPRRGPRSRAVGPDAALALAPGDLQGGLPAHVRPRGGRERRGPARRTTSRRGAARPCWPG